jgi:thioesterase domain-containing protein
MMGNDQLEATPTKEKDQSSAAVRETVLSIWHRTMGPKGRDPNADLCQMGIGVKRLFRMLDEIEQTLGRKIPPGTALRLRTAEAIANAIATDRWPAPSPLLLLKDGDDRPPLYVIAGGHRIVLEIIALARATQHGGKTWGLQAPGLEGETPELETVEETAARFVEQLGGDPEVPVNIVGYSFGGEIAFEMARILHARNRKLGLVGLVDTLIAERHWPLAMRLRYLAHGTLSRIRTLTRSPAGGRAEAFGSLMRPFINRVMGAFSYDPTFSESYEPELDPRIKVVKDLAIQAHERYAPRPVDFPVVLFKSRRAQSDLADRVQMWRPSVRKLEIVEVEGSHTTMVLPPHVHGLAAEISARLVQTVAPHQLSVRKSAEA